LTKNEYGEFKNTHFDLILKRLTKTIFYEFKHPTDFKFFAFLLLRVAEKRKNFEEDIF